MGFRLLLVTFELICCRLLRTSSLMAIYSAVNTANILMMLYTGFYSLGFLAYLFVLVAHSPYLISILRLAWRRESEHRRRMHHQVVRKLYLL